VRGLIPLLYHRLSALDFHGVPPPVRRKLTDTFGVNAIRNLLLAEELTRVLTQFGAAGVAVIPLKGVALAESLYGDTALRTCADLDILIHPKDLAESLNLLQSSGYKTHYSQPAFVQLLARYGKDCALMREDARQAYPLQLHCGLNWGGPQSAPCWPKSGPSSSPPLSRRAGPCPEPEWEFLYLAVHVARHGLFPFKWLADLDWLVARGALDWKKVQIWLGGLGWEKAVSPALPLAQLCWRRLPWTLGADHASQGSATPHLRPRASRNPTGNAVLHAAAPPAHAEAPLSCHSDICPHACGWRASAPSLRAVLLYYFLRPGD